MPSSSRVPRLVSTDETEEKGLRTRKSEGGEEGDEGRRGYRLEKRVVEKRWKERGWKEGTRKWVLVRKGGRRRRGTEGENKREGGPRDEPSETAVTNSIVLRLSTLGPLPSYSPSSPFVVFCFSLVPRLGIYIPFHIRPLFSTQSNPRGHRPNHTPLARSPPLPRRNHHLLHRRNLTK